MGLFNKLFNGSDEPKEEKNITWIPLSTMEQLDDIQSKSLIKTQAIFKHSTRCGISRMVLKQFEADFNLSENQIDLNFLDLLIHRDISNEIAAKFQVMHESPQLLIIRNGVVIAHSSHGGINDLLINKYV
jgi:bacillithiol system protein YtxJ